MGSWVLEVVFHCSEYMLGTDASSREFIAQNCRWFLDTFDSYPYAIQRAGAIRYFVLHHYGGIYTDLDIGCVSSAGPPSRLSSHPPSYHTRRHL